MEKQSGKMLDLSKIDTRKALILGVALALVVLIVALCITGGMKANIQEKYTSARNEIGEQLYNQLYMLCQTFDQVTIPGAEVQDVIIPDMREYFLSAETLNEALISGFGDRYAVLNNSIIEAIGAAFEEYDEAFRTGQATDSAQAAMQMCVETLRGLLAEHYPKGILAG